MKYVGLILATAGLAFLAFGLYSFWKNKNRLRTPVPYNEDVKVIIVTPSE